MAKRPLVYMTAPYSTDHAPSVAIVEGRSKDVYPIAVGYWHHLGQVVDVPIPADAPTGTYQCLEVQVDSIGHPLWPDELQPPVAVDTRCHCGDTSGLCGCW